MIIQKVMQNKHTKQKTVTIPKDSEINKGDYVMINKIKGEQKIADKNLSAIAKTKPESANQTKANKVLKEIGLE